MQKMSVVIPCFNLGKYLDETVDSVLAQTLRDVEIIVINPGSTDAFTSRLLADYARPLTRVIQTPQMGVSASRNLGIREARSPYICCLDSDDVLEPSCFERTVRVLDAAPTVGFVSFWYRMFGEDEGVVTHESCSLRDFLMDNAACAASVFRKAAWESSGGYDERLTAGFEDWDFWLGILARGWEARIVREFLFRYRVRSDARHHVCDSAARRKTLYRMLMAKYEKEFRANATELIAGKDDLFAWACESWHYTRRRLVINERERERAQRLIEEKGRELHAVYSSWGWKLGSGVQAAVRYLRGAPYRLALRLLPPGAKDAVPVPLINCARLLSSGGRGERLFRQRRREGPLVSVVIPCYNYGRYLDEALSSALSQTLENREIIVIDDVSTYPLTVEKIAELEARRLPGVTVIRQENRGVCRARNNAIRAARGKYICCLDADDVLDPTYLEKCAAAMESGGLDICYSWVRFFGGESRVWQTGPFDPTLLMQANCVPCAAVFTKAAWGEACGYNPLMKDGNEDWDFWISIAGAGGRGRVIPEALFRYRRHGAGRDAEALKRMDELVERIRLNHPDLYAGKVPRPRPCLVALNPFVNLAPGAPRVARAERILVLAAVAGPDEARRAEEMCRGGAEVHVISLGGPGAAGNFSSLTPYVFTPSAFLPERFRAPFVLDYLRRRGIGAVVCPPGTRDDPLVAAIRKQFPGVEIRGAV